MTTTPLLSVSGLRVTYGGVVALRDVDLTVAEGETVAVLGANGAGKTSLLRAITGLESPAAGSITFDGLELAGAKPHVAAGHGLAHVPDHRGLFPSMTVRENLDLAALALGRRPDADALAEIHDLFPILEERRSQPAGTMSGGQQQMLTIARALLQEPRLLLLDEMSMGLAPAIVSDLFRVLRRLQQRGIGILLVEQFVGGALGVADRIVLLEQGRVVASGTPEEVGGDELAAAYLGADDTTSRAAELAAAGPPDRVREHVSVGLDPRHLRRLQARARARGQSVDELLAELATDVDAPEVVR